MFIKGSLKLDGNDGLQGFRGIHIFFRGLGGPVSLYLRTTGISVIVYH